MSIRTIAIATAAAVVIGAAGYFVGTGLDASGAAEPVATMAPAEPPAATPSQRRRDDGGAAQRRRSGPRSRGSSRTTSPIIPSSSATTSSPIPRSSATRSTNCSAKQDAQEQAAQVAAIGDNRDLLFSSPRQVVMGNPKGDVTLIEFFDYNCGYCRRAQADMQQLIADDPNLKVVLKEFPVLGDGSIEASQVSIAVRMLAPDKSGDFHDALIAQSGQVNGDVALAVAEELGLDRAKIEETMASDEVKDTITEVYALAAEAVADRHAVLRHHRRGGDRRGRLRRAQGEDRHRPGLLRN